MTGKHAKLSNRAATRRAGYVDGFAFAKAEATANRKTKNLDKQTRTEAHGHGVPSRWFAVYCSAFVRGVEAYGRHCERMKSDHVGRRGQLIEGRP